MASEARSQDDTRQQALVRQHLAQRLSLQPGQLKLLRRSARDLPAGVDEYHVEAKGNREQGPNCLVRAEQVYCAGVAGEFERFLHDYGYFDKRDLDARQLMRLYAILALPPQLKYIDQATLERRAAEFGALAPIVVKAPALAHDAAGATMTLTFFATPALKLEPTEWIVTLSRGYELAVRKGASAAARP